MTFYLDKEWFLSHGDGWRYRIFYKDDNALTISYQEYDADLKVWQDVTSMDGIWDKPADIMLQSFKKYKD